MHHSVYRLLLNLLVPVLLAGAQVHAFTVQQVVMNPSMDKHADWVQLIKSAKSEVRLAMFNFSEPSVIEALKEAARNKIDVEVLFDLNNSKKAEKVKMLADLESAGVKVIRSSPEFTISHQKAMAIDREKVLISTINLTRHADTTRGYGIVTADKEIVAEFLKVFDQDRKNAQNGTAITPKLNTELIWSPNHGAEKLIDLIDSAKTSIVVQVENLSHDRIIDALGNAQEKRNVKVRVITPLCDFNDDPFFNFPALRKLELRGVDARVMGIPNTFDQPYIHAKMITVDGKKTYLGSLNFSYNSLQKAREVGVVLTDKTAVDAVSAAFDKDWGQAIELPEDTKTINCPKL